MKTVKEFGKLSQVVDLRKYWEKEAGDFTPWLAKQENLDLLSDTIGIDLELVGIEQSVGGFKVDILTKETDSDKYVVIENQLEKTDHTHLGQLLTYASGYSAKAVIWVAKEICEEHRKALDWLNETTSDDVAFFGVEMELWKIGDSQPAPKFNLVSQPNDWFKTVQQASRSRRLTETEILRKEFWTELLEYMKTNNAFLRLPNKASTNYYYTLPRLHSIGKTRFWIAFVIRSKTKKIDCELCIGGDETRFDNLQKDGFEGLKKDKEVIEQELGAQLKWEEKHNVRKIVQFTEADIQNKEEWPRLFEWLKERAEAFHNTFSDRVQNLELDDEAA